MGERSEPRQHAREGRGREKENSRLLSRASRLATFHDIPQMDSPSKAIGELATFRSLDVKYIHRKSRCEMLIGGDDISNDVTCFSTSVYIRARFRFALFGGNLTAQSTGSHRGIGGSRDVVASSPSFFRPSARTPRRVCSQAIKIQTVGTTSKLSET